jgi:hypothetical protein
MSSDNRKILFIDKSLQLYFLKLLAGSCILCIIAMSLSSFGFYYSVREFYERSQNPQLLQILNLVDDYLWIYLIYITTSLILCAMIITYAWLVISNRFAGPAYRIQKNIEGYLHEGRFAPIVLRKNDVLKGLATTVNTLMDQVAQNKKPPT